LSEDESSLRVPSAAAGRADGTYPREIVWSIAFLWGLQFAFLNPALALLLVSLFGASTGQVSIVLAIYNAACLLAAWAIPRWADRRADYVRPMIGCAIFTVGLCAVLVVAHQLAIAVIGLVMLGAPAAVGSPLLFGYVRHSGGPPGAVVTTRAVFSMAWVAGPPIAAAVISVAGGHALVWAIGAVGVLNVVATTLLFIAAPPTRRTENDEQHAPAPAAAPAARRVIAVFIAIFAVLQATNTAAVSITTLFVTDELGLSPLWGGIALGVAAGLEVPVLLVLGRRHGRYSDVRMLMLACLLGAAYYGVMAVTQNGGTVIAAQALNATFYAIITGIGLTLFQRIIAGPGAAAGVLSNAQRIGSLLAGPLIGVGSLFAGGLRVVFVACAILAVLNIALLQVARRWGVPPPTASDDGHPLLDENLPPVSGP
jgi:SET family sugar efflux transporter-like MFS transporter